MISATATSCPGRPYQLEIEAGGHKVISDAPFALGGQNTGMTPHEQFLGGLAGCMAMTLWMYARDPRRNWDLQSVKVTITETKVNDPNQPGKKILQYDEQIEVTGPNLTQQQVDKLLAVAPLCPVHQCFTGPKLIATNINRTP